MRSRLFRWPVALAVAAFCWVNASQADSILTRRTDLPYTLAACVDATKFAEEPAHAVPAIIARSPELLEHYLATVNPTFGETRTGYPGFSGIAQTYKRWCEPYAVRWDLAFAQMLIETNYLRYTGSVSATALNFAGIAATHSESPGETFSSMAEGVKAHCQHLATYGLMEIPPTKCAAIDDVACLTADRTIDVGRRIVHANVCTQFARPARFAELGPDDFGPCTSEKRTVNGRSVVHKECPNDIVRWATGQKANGYGKNILRLHGKIMEKASACSEIADIAVQVQALSVFDRCEAPSRAPEEILAGCFSLSAEDRARERAAQETALAACNR